MPTFAKTLESSWGEVTSEWKRGSRKCSEKSIHDLRVRIRRLIATLDLLLVMQQSTALLRLRRRFKKVLRQLGPLRDLQVALARIRATGCPPGTRSFRRSLERAEEKAIREVQELLTTRRRRKLKFRVLRILDFWRTAQTEEPDGFLPAEVKRLLRSRYRRFESARRRFNPAEADSLHAMRIAFKRFRYTIEEAQEMFHAGAGPDAVQMHTYQKTMGDLRDVQLLEAHLQDWCRNRESSVAVAFRPVLDQLKQERELLQTSLTVMGQERTFKSWLGTCT